MARLFVIYASLFTLGGALSEFEAPWWAPSLAVVSLVVYVNTKLGGRDAG